MPSKPCKFTQADVERAIRGAVKGAQAAGLDLSRVEFETPVGKIVLFPSTQGEAIQMDDLDQELAEFEARHEG